MSYATPEYAGGGAAAAARLTGLHPSSPLVSSRPGGPGLRFDADAKMGRISTSVKPSPANGGIGGDIAGVRHLDDWRDAFNPQSPAFWGLLFLLAMLGFMQLRVRVGGKRGVKAAIG